MKDHPRSDGSGSRFDAFVEGLIGVIGHADRAKPLRDYCLGLLMPCERKSVEPLAAITAPERTAAQHQSLLHFIGEGRWSDEKVLTKVREMVLPEIERHGPIQAWIIDDTGFPKQGRHSVGVARQYCGQLGKQDNCQVAVSLSLANHAASLPVAYQLYLPEEWAQDHARRRKTGVPEDIVFKTKPQIALEQVRKACEAGLPHGVVLMDAGYGANTDLRTQITALGLTYVAGILPQATVWAPGRMPLRPKRWSGRGQPPKLLRRDRHHQPISVKQLAFSLPAKAWRTIAWREGSNERLSSRFARLRVRVAHRDYKLTRPRSEEWLLIEWPKGEKEPTKYWLSNVPENIAFAEFVDLAKLRWRIERDYQDLKQEVGLGHFEGRGWRGFHHHATLCIAAYGLLISERETIPPSAHRSTALFQEPVLPKGYRPRGSATASRTTHPELHRDDAPAPHHRSRHKAEALSMLHHANCAHETTEEFMTQ
jgi:SRSO17 transposase